MTKRSPGTALAVGGALLSLTGAALYVLPGPGLPVLATGLATLTAGLLTRATSRRARRDPRPRGETRDR
ncbi:hypothetical protein [Streptomyces prasinopilosus]|uniref:Putative transmembrane protein (PGPGW) n=1 Tax=Streptomyces prasinopilosus TaxID=67344 RepID=A0A1G6P1U3_9ACTN|nr:hypothetical protein [Streptomyces prasinopilosus]SDC73968.1 Putative transmembrane protein (PGPGW) [Streptomyces prasinopilosus]